MPRHVRPRLRGGQFTDRRLRRIGAVHGLIPFTSNTAVLALAINLPSRLF